jgi:hypothetical protein
VGEAGAKGRRFVTTTLDTFPANWYPDPSGRAQARYWDGRMWTAHVVRDGVAALDQLDGVQQPREPAPFTHAVVPAAPAPSLGHGAHALQEMATARSAPRSSTALAAAPPPLPAEPRISTPGAIAIFLGALLLIGVGVYLFRQGVFTVDTTPGRLERSVTVEQPDYRVTVPGRWLERVNASSVFDAVYSVPDDEILNVAVVDFADAALSDPAARDQHLALAGDMVATAIGANPTLVERSTIEVRQRPVRVATYDVTDASGIVTRVRAYFVVGPDRAVIVTGYGTPAAVERHLETIAAVAGTARIR